MKQALFIHGGPGFNSNAESNLLPELFLKNGIQLHFWNEPSNKRPTGHKFHENKAYANWLLSGEKYLEELFKLHGQIILVAQSFGTHMAAYLGHYHPEKIERIIVINPALNQAATDKNILSFTRKDFLESEPDKAARLEEIISNYSGSFTDEVLEGFFMAASNPKFPLHYWQDTDKMGQYYSYGSGQWEFDVESFTAVKRDYYPWDLNKRVTVPTEALFSDSDEITKLSEQLPLLNKIFIVLNLSRFKGTGHFLQIESPESIINGILKEFETCQNQI